jgi:Domain of unknown function (DUF4277)
LRLGLSVGVAGFGDASPAARFGSGPLRLWPPRVEKLLGALPVVVEFCRRLDLAGIIDRACPVREVARVTHGQVIEALVANRLTSLGRCWGWRTGPGSGGRGGLRGCPRCAE